MAFIKKRRGNTTYVYEAKYESIENGKQKYKWNLIGKLDANGNIIPSKKRASTEAASLNNSQNYLNSTSTSTNVGTLGIIGRSGNGNGEIIRTSANSNNDNNVNNYDTTTPMSAMPEMSARHAMPTTATNNNPTAPATTVTDSVPNTPNIPVISDELAMPVAISTANTTPMTNNISYDSYDVFAETPVEASITVSNYKPMEAQISEAFINNDEASQIHLPQSSASAISTTSYDASWCVQEAEEASQRNPPQIPGGTAKKVEHFKISISKPDHIIFDTDKNPQIYEATNIKDVKFTVSGNSSKKKIETLFYIDFNDAKENGITISNEDRINSYDREIYNAVATLAAAGNNELSPSMIFQLLSGNTSDERNKMSPETRNKILRSVEKMSITRVTIDASAEVRAGMIAQAIFKNYLIPAEMTELKINGQIVTDGIRLLSRLPLFDYASRKKQVVSINIKMLDTPLPNTSENIVLKGYLLMRIASIMNSKNNMSDVIRYQTIYDYLKLQAPTPNALKVKHKQVRDKVKKFLDFWKKLKFIKEYKEEKEGRAFAKVIISCYPPFPQQKTHKKIASYH